MLRCTLGYKQNGNCTRVLHPHKFKGAYRLHIHLLHFHEGHLNIQGKTNGTAGFITIKWDCHAETKPSAY